MRWLAPQRPRLTIANAGPHPPGPVTLTVSEAPPQGFCWLGATLAAPIAERAVSTLLGSPLWLALPDPAQLSVVAWPLDPGGYGAGIFNHPGGFAADITLQALALGQSGVGTTQHVILQVHP